MAMAWMMLAAGLAAGVELAHRDFNIWSVLAHTLIVVIAIQLGYGVAMFIQALK
jgi:hypothetical protein